MRRAATYVARYCALAGLLLPAAVHAQTAPVLSMPGAGALTAVIETRERDGFDQRLRYAGGDGRNHAEIALRQETADLLPNDQVETRPLPARPMRGFGVMEPLTARRV